MRRPQRSLPMRLWWRGARTWSGAWAYGILPTLVASAHLLEVHLLDASAGALARGVVSWEFDTLARLEEPLTRAIEGWHTPRALAGVSAYYLGAFLLLLAGVPALVAADGNPRLLKRTLLSYPALYLIALPWFLLFPSVNPYSRLGAASPFDALHPQLEELYYLLTTRDNTFPSLHVAFTAVLVLQLMRTRWGLLKHTVAIHGMLLIASVVFLRVHYVSDVLAGIATAWLALRLVDSCLDGRLAFVGRALDRACERWSPRRTRAYLALEARAEAAERRL